MGKFLDKFKGKIEKINNEFDEYSDYNKKKIVPQNNNCSGVILKNQ